MREMKNKLFNIDYSIRSSYLGRWATLIVFSAIILIALGALFLEQDDFAHVPVPVGVQAFDSATAYDPLTALAGFVRENGGGDITWRFMDRNAEPGGCALYLMTAVQAAPYIRSGMLECFLLASVQEGRRYARGGLIVRPGTTAEDIRRGSLIFTSPISADGFLSPAVVCAREGFINSIDDERISFAGTFNDELRVIYGVHFGAFTAGGIGLERLEYLRGTGVVRNGEIEVFAEGPAVPALLLAVDASYERQKFDSFRGRFLTLCERVPPQLASELREIGVAGFELPGTGTAALIAEMDSLLTMAAPFPAAAGDAGSR
jgi:hypothetical protein